MKKVGIICLNLKEKQSLIKNILFKLYVQKNLIT